MINSALIVAGIVFIAISVVQCLRLIKINAVRKLRWQWYLMLCLILFFLFGYIGYYFLSTNYGNIPINSLLIDLILFFGAVFVIGVLSISYQLIELLTKNTLETNQINNNLAEETKTLVQKQSELEKVERLLKEKNTELQSTLEDFYTIRLSMQKDMELGRVKEENEKIKEKIEKLKTQ